MPPAEVTVADYGLGNLLSILRALRRTGCTAVASSDPEALRKSERLVLPGVGAFGDGMAGLHARGLDAAVREFHRTGRPLLGICLGMQLLLDEGDEFGVHAGLRLVPGRTRRLHGGEGFKVPHVGWSPVRPVDGAPGWGDPLMRDLGDSPYFYFVHSYFAAPSEPGHRLGETSYGEETFCSILRSGSLIGCQFHPEKSGPVGLRLLENFLKL